MTRPGDHSKPVFRAVAALAICWGLAFVIACRVNPVAAGLATGSDTVIGRVLGSTRVFIGKDLFDEADTYFHLGVAHAGRPAFRDSWYQATARVVAPDRHVHPEGASIYEVMPWLRFATEVDPHNVEAYLAIAFWLAGQGKRPDLAARSLLEAQRNNPTDYRILMERARLYIQDQDDLHAAKTLDLGLKLWPSPMPPTDPQARLDLAQMLAFRAFIANLQGQPQLALKLFKMAHQLFPHNAALGERIADLEQGKDTSLWTRRMWTMMFPRNTRCAREGEAGHVHDHDHEHGDDHDHEDDHNGHQSDDEG